MPNEEPVAPQLDYQDAYLKSRITTDIEDRAYADVDRLGAFPQAWRDDLAVIRAYILTCIEKQSSGEDLFTAKLDTYRREFDAMLKQARAAKAETTGASPAFFTVPIRRG